MKIAAFPRILGAGLLALALAMTPVLSGAGAARADSSRTVGLGVSALQSR